MAVRVIEVTEQVSSVVAGDSIAATGGVIFWVIMMLSVSAHPLDEVTVTAYVPGAVTFNVADVPTILVPSDHE